MRCGIKQNPVEKLSPPRVETTGMEIDQKSDLLVPISVSWFFLFSPDWELFGGRRRGLFSWGKTHVRARERGHVVLRGENRQFATRRALVSSPLLPYTCWCEDSMLRFPNPGSDIPGFIRIFTALFEDLANVSPFTLDDISSALIRRNLASSCGYMGEEALRRSTKEDRSLDQLYNQSKMYSELYRVLGWIMPQPNDKLRFSFTLLGAHVYEARGNPDALVRESMLGMAYPNSSVEVKGSFRLRPFSSILRAMRRLNGMLCRDELIVGPLCLTDDRSSKLFEQLVSDISGLRGSSSRLAAAIKKLGAQRKITATTMGNYTRFPLAVLTWSGWSEKKRVKGIYGNSTIFQVLTPAGEQLADELETLHDLRASDFEHLKADEQRAVAQLSFYRMLARSGFDTSPVNVIMGEHSKVLKRVLPSIFDKSDFLFSPFQEMSPEFLQTAFPQVSAGTDKRIDLKPLIIDDKKRETKKQFFQRLTLIESGSTTPINGDEGLVKQLAVAYEAMEQNVELASDLIATEYGSANKTVFYPLVAALFRIAGFNCHVSRVGVNYQRSDAFITHATESIPIEIKSPGEEFLLSVKAVRQAVENKVVLLARKAAPTKRDTTTLAVGFNLPNDRAEVMSLICDMKKAFDLRVGVIDFRTLVSLAIKSACCGLKIDHSSLSTLYGILELHHA